MSNALNDIQEVIRSGIMKASKVRKMLRAESAQFPAVMTEIPRDQWPEENPRVLRVWRSREFQAVLWDNSGHHRLSVNRTVIDNTGSWLDGITWDDLQRIKRECGFGLRLAVEMYPPDDDVVNVANMRHLWFPKEALGFGWGSRKLNAGGDV